MSPSYSNNKHFSRRPSTPELRIFLSQSEIVAGMQPAVAMAGKPRPVRTGGRAQSQFGFCLLAALILLLFCCNFKLACAQDYTAPTQFVLHDFNASTISCIGDSTATSSDDTIRLTAPGTHNDSSQISGGCFYSNSVQFSSNLSFSTMFSFDTSTMLDNDQEAYISFFISGACDSASAAATSQCLGLFGRNRHPNAQGLGFDVLPAMNQSILVQLDLQYGKALGEQVSDSFSGKEKWRGGGWSAGPLPAKGQFDKTYVWIEYWYDNHNAEYTKVSVSSEPKKPCEPSMAGMNTGSATLGLGEIVNSHSQSVVGFFISTAPESDALTKVYDWSFSASGPAEDIFEGQEKCLTAAAKRQKLILEIVLPILGATLVLFVGFVLYYRRAHMQNKDDGSLSQVNEPLVSDQS